jgi:outer membrane lipoprotein LolB
MAAFIGGCATAPPEQASEARREAAFAAHQAQVRGLSQWTLYARAAINMPRDSGTVSLFWRQQDVAFTMTLRAPMGSGTVRIRGDSDGVELRTSDGRQDSHADARVLIERHTGYALPVGHLRYWVLGVPSPDERAITELDARGHLERLRQAGWTLTFDDYREISGTSLPGTIRARGQGVELKLAVQQWSVDGQSDG